MNTKKLIKYKMYPQRAKQLTGVEAELYVFTIHQLEELFNSDTCPLCGKRKVKIEGGFEHICTQKIEK